MTGVWTKNRGFPEMWGCSLPTQEKCQLLLQSSSSSGWVITQVFLPTFVEPRVPPWAWTSHGHHCQSKRCPQHHTCAHLFSLTKEKITKNIQKYHMVLTKTFRNHRNLKNIKEKLKFTCNLRIIQSTCLCIMHFTKIGSSHND